MNPPATPPGEPGVRRSPFAVLRHHDFALYWSGQAISLTGTWMQALAQNWVVVGLTSSALALGLLRFVSSLPMLMLTLSGGVVADRFDKRRILIVTQAVLMLLAFAMAALIHTGHIRLWQIFLIGALNGLASAYDMPANQALTPELVEREEIPQAIALNQSIFNGSRIVGPTLAGVLIGALGLTSAFVANGLSFLAVIGSLLLIRSRPRSPHAPQGRAASALLEGLAYVRERPRLGVLMGMVFLTSFVVFPNMAVMMPLYAKQVLGMGARELGILMGASGTGALIGSLLLLGVRKEQRLLRIALGLAGMTVALAMLSGVRGLLLPCSALFLSSLAFSSALGLVSTIIQEVVPGHLRGRVMSLNSLMFVGVMPISSLVMTGLADWVGLPRELLISSAMFGAGSITLLLRFAASPELPEPATR